MHNHSVRKSKNLQARQYIAETKYRIVKNIITIQNELIKMRDT